MARFAEIAESDHVAVIGDLVASRELPERADVQDVLRQELAVWSRRLARATVAPFAITAGDEFEGLFDDPAPVFEFVRELTDALGSHPSGPVELRFGIGRGTLATPVPDERRRRRVGELDGPAFHAARDALVRAERDGMWIAVEGWGEAEDAVLEALARMLGVVRGEWTRRQAETVAAARDAAQKDVARAFGVSPSVVSESLKAAHFTDCLAAERALALGLARLGS